MIKSILATIGTCMVLCCTSGNRTLTYFQVNDLYVNLYVQNKQKSIDSLLLANAIQKDDSLVVGITFDISYCDSSKKVFSNFWQPARGYKGSVSEIKEFQIWIKNNNGKRILSKHDLQVVRDSLDYVIKQKNGVFKYANSHDYSGCIFPVDSFIQKFNFADRCYILDGLNGTHLLYYINTALLSPGENVLGVDLIFEDYSLKKSVLIQFSSP